VLNGAAYSLQYDVYKDFEPVSLLSSNPLVIVTNNKVPAKDLQELIGWIKANKDTVAVGLGSMAHRVAAVYFQNLTGASLTFVPYRGAGPATQDLISGQIQIMFDQVANSIPHIKAGSTKAYGMTSASRLAAMPEIPNVDEAGLPGFYISAWNAVWVPKGTPKPIIAKLNAAIGEALADPAVSRQLTGELGQELPSPQQQTPEYLGAWHKAEIEKWWPLLKAANIRGE
jgi:tripartite-type tricarboxylate transporter receptor subunit TctC